MLTLQDRLIQDTVEARIEIARLLRTFKPRTVFTTQGSGVHPDHRAVTDIVVHGVFYARLPKWEELAAGERLRDLEPHENRAAVLRALPHGAAVERLRLRR